MNPKTIIFLILALFLSVLGVSGEDSVTNKIAKELRWTMYSARATTVASAKIDHDGTALNCIQYAYRIKDIAEKNGKEVEIWYVSSNHAVAVVKEGNKRTCYSNGKIVKEWAYSKISRLK